MKIMESGLFAAVDWNRLPADKHPGETGMSVWRMCQAGEVRTRIVLYSPGFRSDHWCPRGHILLVLEGELTVELKDGRSFTLMPGGGFIAGDDPDNPHLAHTGPGAKVFIVD
jgi:quercetin dioxygenase-like cupin family protein